MHGIKNPDLGQMLKTAVQESKKALGKVVFFPPRHKQQNNNCWQNSTCESYNHQFKMCDCDLQGLVSERPAVIAHKEERDRTSGIGAPSAKRLKSQFRCSKCGFITDDRTQFQQHIPQHKTDENTPQCLHCGLCFTSLLSLNRHLFIVHKVKEEEKRKQVVAAVRELEQDDQRDGSADTDEGNDVLSELNEPEPSQAGEPESVRCDTTVDCNLKLSAHSQTQAVSLR